MTNCQYDVIFKFVTDKPKIPPFSVLVEIFHLIELKFGTWVNFQVLILNFNFKI